MKRFKDIKQFGDMTGQTYNKGISLIDTKLTSLEGAPIKIMGSFYCYDNLLTSLEFAPKYIVGTFSFGGNQIENPKEEIIKHQVRAIKYSTDKGIFDFKEIEKDFNEFEKLNSVKSKGFRTLLGLEGGKWNLKIQNLVI